MRVSEFMGGGTSGGSQRVSPSGRRGSWPPSKAILGPARRPENNTLCVARLSQFSIQNPLTAIGGNHPPAFHTAFCNSLSVYALTRATVGALLLPSSQMSAV